MMIETETAVARRTGRLRASVWHALFRSRMIGGNLIVSRIAGFQTSALSREKSEMAKHSPRFLQIVEAVRINIQECTVNDVHNRVERGDKFLLFDVREESEYAAGHVPGAKWLGKGIIERDIETVVPDPDTEMVLYCGGGFRSALAADNLQKMGYTNVISMDGGFRGWQESGFEVTK